ncbi:MAG: 50S ribosomal protein L25 [Roseibacillus sp.]|jgi:large subunit ribosomal protein L25|nr:50S ribosomal protein L25 [Roseibacillus sp.]|tara:strand:- start:51 stop:719 length:669 start_codon:yes stop_codon:yes gene_type:complete
MSKTHTIKAEDRKRTGTGTLKLMRREGFIPSVVYGGGSENRNVKVRSKAFREVISQSASTNILVTLELDGGGSQLAFVKDLQHDPISGNVLHADFLAIGENTEITAQIPVTLTGEAIGVKAGGQLEQLLYNIEIKCLPKDLPESLTADVTDLDVGSVLHIGEVPWPEGAMPTLNDDVVVALVAKARVAESEEDGEGGEGGEGGEDGSPLVGPAPTEGEEASN